MKSASIKKLISFFFGVHPTREQLSNIVRHAVYARSKTHSINIRRFKPFSMGLFVTERCNLNCPSCSYGIPRQQSGKSTDVTTEQFQEILAHPLLQSCVKCAFEGGEPLLHDGFFHLVDIAYRRKLFTTTFSNGLLVHRYAKEIVQSPLGSITISLYDAVLEKQIEGISALIRQRRRQGRGPIINIARIFKSDTYRDIGRFIELAIRLCVDGCYFQNYMVPHGNKEAIIYDDDSGYSEYRTRILSEYGGKISFNLPMAVSREEQLAKRLCRQPMECVLLNRFGEIAPCCGYFNVYGESLFGNLFDNDAWNNPAYQELRTALLDDSLPIPSMCRHCFLLSRNLMGLRNEFPLLCG